VNPPPHCANFFVACHQPLCYYGVYNERSIPAHGTADASLADGDLSTEAGFLVEMRDVVKIVWDER